MKIVFLLFINLQIIPRKKDIIACDAKRQESHCLIMSLSYSFVVKYYNSLFTPTTNSFKSLFYFLL